VTALLILLICAARVFAFTGSADRKDRAQAAVLIAGGDEIAGPTPFIFVSTAELYDPKSGTFTRTLGNMNDSHGGSLATLLRDGQVLFTGGSDAFPASAESELYDPTTQSFTNLGDRQDREEHVSELLKNGEVLVAGGVECCLSLPLTASAELFDPKSNRFTMTGSLSITRGDAQNALLANGQVLVAGGFTGAAPGRDFEVTSSAELYDGKNSTFRPTGRLLAATAGGDRDPAQERGGTDRRRCRNNGRNTDKRRGTL
jgi:hypothetical protein